MNELKGHIVLNPLTLFGGVLLLGAIGYGAFTIYSLSQEVGSLTSQLASTTTEAQNEHADLTQKVVTLSDTLYTQQQQVEALQQRLGGFESTVGSITGTVNVLQKLSNTDPELLQKYSKTYFLNENYVPKSLTEIPQQYVFSNKKIEQIQTLVWPHLQAMLQSATSSNNPLYIASAYRSFGQQQTLKSKYSVTYGAGTANSFSADQGYSEHQLGTAVDLITTGTGGQLDGFEKTSEYTWLTENAYKYGFILSYPQGNTFYVFEPWHWRFVGVALATFLHYQNLFFYNLEQRQIDDYLANIFD